MNRLACGIFIVLSAVSFAAAQKPPLNVTIEPMESGSVVYSPLAARSTAFGPTGQIGLLLGVENLRQKEQKITKITIGYDGDGGPYTEKVITPNEDNTLPFDVAGHSLVYWNSRRDFIAATNTTWDTMIYTPFNYEPNIIIIKLYSYGFSEPYIISKAIKKHRSPFFGTANYRFPGKAEDMRHGEYWATSSHHGTSAYGSQLFSYDMGVAGWDSKLKGYSEILPDTTGCSNEDYRIYGKPVYAMADGDVIRFQDNVNENPMPWRLYGDNKKSCPTKAERDALDCTKLPANTGGGNYFAIKSGDELNSYAHLQEGSLNPALVTVDSSGRPNARVKAGDYLGRVGNAGCSTNPHIHFDVVQIHNLAQVRVDTQNNHPNNVSLRPLMFDNIYVIDKDLAMRRDPEPEKWTRVDGRAIPTQYSLIWASKTKPCYYNPGHSELAMHGVTAADYETIYNRAIGCGYRPVWVDGFYVNGRNYYNAIFHYLPDSDIVSRHKENLGSFNNTRADLEGKGYRLIFVDSYLAKSGNLFSSIYVRDSGPATKVTPDLSPEDHDKELDKRIGDGWYPINVSVYNPLALGRRITTLYQKGGVGKVLLKSYLSEQEYDDYVDREEKDQMRLFHVNAYRVGSKVYFAAIWHRKTTYSLIGAGQDMSATGYQNKYNEMTGQGFLTHAVTGYERGNKMTFAAIWVKK